jgi:hypothetical protein
VKLSDISVKTMLRPDPMLENGMKFFNNRTGPSAAHRKIAKADW